MTNIISKIAKTLVMGLALSTSIGVYADGGSTDVIGLGNTFKAIEVPINTAMERIKELYQIHGMEGISAEQDQLGADGEDHPYLASLTIGPKYGLKIKFKTFTGGGIQGKGSDDKNDINPVPQILSEAQIIIFSTEVPTGDTIYNGTPPANLTLFECATDADSKVKAFYADAGNEGGLSFVAKEATELHTIPYLTGCYSVNAAQMETLTTNY